MINKRPSRNLLLAAAIAAALPVPAALAQQGPTAIEEIVVTARKREEALQDVPVAITALSAAALEERQIGDLAEMGSTVPNLTIYAARGSNTTLTAYMRGVGQADPLWGVDPGVALYVDDVYIARPQGALLDVYDIERIEVLRGPQGTLYGKNTIGGAIRYVSAPLESEWEGSFGATIGNYGQTDWKAMLNIPLGERAAFRIAGASLENDGYGTNLVQGVPTGNKDAKAARAALRWQPSDELDIRFSADFTRDDSNPRGAQRLVPNRFEPLFSGQPPRPANDNPFDVDSDFEPINRTDMDGYSLTIDWAASETLGFKSITAYREGETLTYIDFDTLPYPIANVSATYEDDQLSQEFQLLYDDGGKMNGVLGFYYFDGSAGGQVRNNFLGLLFGDTQGTMDTESWAVFGEGTYQLTDTLGLTVGVRYTSEKKSVDVLNRGYSDATYTTPISVAADFDDSKTFDSFAPRVVLDWRARDNVMAYLSYSEGFKSGGFNVRANQVAVPDSAEPFDDETITTYEIGAKTTWADGRLTVNGAYFFSDYEDIQLSVFTAYDSNGDGVDDAFFGDFTNAGAGEVQGIELEIAAYPVDGLALQLTGAWLDTEYTEYITAGVNVADQQKFTNAPEWQFGFNGTYTHGIGSLGTLTWQAGYTYQSEVYPTTDLSELIKQGSYGLVNASLAWVTEDQAWRIALWGKNLADEEYRTTGYNIETALGIHTGFYGAPRTYGLSVSYNW
jgi:iron complex outermembrane recepter protein